MNPPISSKFSRQQDAGRSPSRIKRRVFCVHYRACLDHAVKMKWEGFSCTRCGSYQEEDTSGFPEHWQQQAESCGKMLKAVFIDKPKKGPGDYKPRPMEPVSPEELQRLWEETRRFRVSELCGHWTTEGGTLRAREGHHLCRISTTEPGDPERTNEPG
jgi:hypothetical protein